MVVTWTGVIIMKVEERCWVEPTSNSIGLGKGWKIFSDQNKIIDVLILASHEVFAGNYSSLL